MKVNKKVESSQSAAAECKPYFDNMRTRNFLRLDEIIVGKVRNESM